MLTVVDHKGAKKPQYKDYVTFLGTYKGRKDDQCNSVATSDSGVSLSLNNSSNNSSSSINSDLMEAPRNGFKEYLELYNNKKYSSVQPGFIKKQKETVKTEVYIEINPSSNVSKVSKMFEKNSQFDKNKVKQEQKITPIGEMTKKFETGTVTPKAPLKKTPSISEKTKLFEHVNTKIEKEDNSCMSPKPIINNIKPVVVPKTKLVQNPQTVPCPPPPPPPLPPSANFTSSDGEKVLSNGWIQNGKKNDVVDAPPVIDKNDPRVKKLVYGALRGMYGAYHDKANDYIATLPRNRVKKNNGLDRIIDSIAQPTQLPGTGPGFGLPPPQNSTGHIPADNLKVDTKDIKMDPPQCVQNAMMTKDKKPFTYTPGGIDLSEVRSPRMARRIERNANLGGAGDTPRPQLPPPQNQGHLPPSVEAMMRPHPQVQVFPSGPPPPPSMGRGGAPPPPPAMVNIPPPPPPPSGPLPTQKVRTGDNQMLERPDMTKIIPDNPMALLRKTSGPQPRRSLLDEMFAQQGNAPASPPASQQRSPPYEPEQPRYQPPIVERGAPISPVPQQYQPMQKQQSPEEVREQPRYQPPVIERQQTLPRQNNVQPEVKTSTAHLGSLYIPPANQQQPQKRVSPPTPPERNLDSPNLQTPPLREAPRPWQTKKPQQEEMPPWAKREQQATSEKVEVQPVQQSQSPQQQRWPQSRTIQQPQYNQPQPQPQPQFNQQAPPVRIEIRTNTKSAVPYQQPGEAKPNAVYITQPVVLQHPGPGAPPPQQRQQQQQQRVDGQGARVIPIQIEGSRTPTTPGNDRSLNRQQSWSNNPSQSNSFKIIQKITNTDDDEVDEGSPVTEHAPKYPQNFQQPPADQMRRMKLSEGDQNLVNKFKQEIHFYDEENPRYRGGHIPSKVFRILDESVIDNDNSEREVDPRYRGPAIPSKAFKLLQNMTDGSPGPNPNKQPVPRGPQPQANRGPQVRTIPVQIEGDDPPQPYVHPSEQVVPEPKKYTGSSIPSRSFKILQAMTAPDNCAKSDEQYEAIPYEQWGFDPNYPPYPHPPYWHDYYYNYYYQEPPSGLSKEDRNESRKSTPTPRQTPVPFWGAPYPYPYPPRRTPDCVESDTETSSRSTPSNSRSTPLPFWGYGYQQYPESEEKIEGPYPPYPYYDPYYYSYYYGYPPMYPPYQYYSDTDDTTGYSSTDEMAYYNKNFKRNNPRGASTPRTVITPTIKVKETTQTSKPEMESDCTDSEDEEEIEIQDQNNPLKSIRSVSNIQVYAEEEESNSHCSDDEVCIEEYQEEAIDDNDEEENVYIVDDDDTYPHQLSVIYEESERTDSRMRCASALSDSTTIADEEETPPTINNPFKFCDGVREIKTLEEKSASVTPRNLSDVDEDDADEEDEDDVLENLEGEEEGKDSDESEDWWGIIGKEDDLPAPNAIILRRVKTLEKIPRDEVKEETIAKDIEVEVVEIAKPNDVIKVRKSTEDLFKELDNKLSDIKSNNNYARANKGVYDKIEDQFEEEENTGKLIELESFVAKLEQIQRESGLWNIEIDTKNKPKILKYTKRGSSNNPETCTGNDEATKTDTSSSASYSIYNSSKSIDSMAQITPINEEIVKTIKDKEQVNIEKNTDDDNNDEETEESSDESDSSEDSSEDESEAHPKQDKTILNGKDKEKQIQMIKERIEALKESIRQKQSKLIETKVSAKEKVTTNQNRSKTTSTKSSLKSFEEYSEEEEVDSGVTSDMSRHISDTEDFPELKKLTRYQRAATHSRLFKLLQDECDNEDGDEVKVTVSEAEKQSPREKSVAKEEPPRRDQLSLPLRKTNESESLSSSGVNSPGSPINEKLVNELVQSLLKRKKGQVFRNMPKEKLYAAAAKILQEDLEIAETSDDCGSFLSPLRDSTGYSTAAQTPQEFNGNYDEYKQYYESWSDAEKFYDENYDILPSKAFKLLQEHSNLNKTGAIAGLLAKCPRVLSSKNIHKKLMKLLESSECPSPTPETPLESNEVTSAS